MADQTDHQQTVQNYIDGQRAAGLSDEQITMHLLQNGWSLDQVNAAMNTGVPRPDVMVLNNMGAQTSNAGTPMQIENVSYNMKMKPVQSKVGLYVKVAGTALWFTTVFVCIFLSSVVQKIAGSAGSLGDTLVFTLSLAVVTTPIAFVAYKKFATELRRNPAAYDDIFFKQAVRRGLWFSIVLGAIAAVVMLYQFLSALFLKDSGGSYASGFSALIFAAGFGGLVFFYWRLHAKTQR